MVLFVILGSLIGVNGLILDIIGAWYLSRGLVRKTLKEIVQEAPQFSFGINEAYVIGALIQKIEATMGFGLLFFGFGLQALPYILNTELSSIYITLWWIISDIAILVAIFKVSDRLVKRRGRTARKKYLREDILEKMRTTEKNLQHIDDTKRYLRHLGVNFEEDICTEDAWQKLLKELEIYY